MVEEISGEENSMAAAPSCCGNALLQLGEEGSLTDDEKTDESRFVFVFQTWKLENGTEGKLIVVHQS